LLAACLLTACNQLPPNTNPIPSYAWNQPEKTRLGRLVNTQARHHPHQSGFALIASGQAAFNDRIAMTELAEKTLDVQYYIWEEDTTGLLLAEHLLTAADRGVRVRILLDDNNMAKRDNSIALLDAHPNIQIRMVNPFAHRNNHLLSFMTDLGRVNHRMHNKSMIVDSALAIVGGRNIGDDYFEVDKEANFRDMDLLAAGPIVKEVNRSFDYLWNGNWSYPITILAKREFSAADLVQARVRMAAYVQAHPYPHALDKEVGQLTQRVNQELAHLVWARGAVIDNDPVSLVKQGRGEISKAFTNKLQTLDQELLIESAYFVGTKAGVEQAKKLIQKGVRVRVLTNSLASNDVLAAHAGYAKWRDDLLKAGVELYELRPDSKGLLLDKLLNVGESKASLHTKSFAFDKKSVFIGSFNLDPRSENINSEIGIYVESPELAKRLAAFMDRGVNPEVAWKLVLNEAGQIRWLETDRQGQHKEYSHEPMTSIWQRFFAGVIRILPIESQL
ncbi:MAG TPA: phospholipase D family protein, partial [Thiolinea sp.]|nr:phospholipase D family protein [Thiolinea sp.]